MLYFLHWFKAVWFYAGSEHDGLSRSSTPLMETVPCGSTLKLWRLWARTGDLFIYPRVKRAVSRTKRNKELNVCNATWLSSRNWFFEFLQLGGYIQHHDPRIKIGVQTYEQYQEKLDEITHNPLPDYEQFEPEKIFHRKSIRDRVLRKYHTTVPWQNPWRNLLPKSHRLPAWSCHLNFDP